MELKTIEKNVSAVSENHLSLPFTDRRVTDRRKSARRSKHRINIKKITILLPLLFTDRRVTDRRKSARRSWDRRNTKITILIPCYNEEKGVGKVIDGVPKDSLKELGYET
jgi:hypothetical protein